MTTTETPADKARSTRMGELRMRLDEIDDELVALNDKTFASEDPEQDRWDDLVAERDTLEPEYRRMVERQQRIDDIKAKTYREVSGAPEVRRSHDDYLDREILHLTWQQARDGALRQIDDRSYNWLLTDNQKTYLDREVRNASRTELARRILVTENEHYHSAWFKLMKDPGAAAFLDNDERNALARYAEYRAQSESSAAGGYAIPVFIDPSIILTDQETDNPFLTLARQVDVNTNAWKGVSSAGVQWAFQAEAAAATDNSLTALAQPTVTVFMARGFIPYSIEISEDWPGFQAEMARVLGIGYDELLISKFTNGNGTTEPRGILTALAASSPTVIVTSMTDGAFGQEDVFATWSALPQKYRRRASWMMSVDVMNKIRQMGTLTNWFATTVQLPDGAISRLFEKGVYENAYFPAF